MATKTITWPDGSTAVLTYTGQGNGTIAVQSDPNNHYESRSVQVTVKTTDGSNIQRTVTIQQAAKVRTDISNAVVTAANQTYSGTAKTPTPTVTLNGVTIPSSGYDVAYSNNTNAGTATITVTGKGDYTGTATGTFTIAKANPTYTAPTARTGLTYSGSSQYLVNAGSTSHGTIQYSSNGTSWSTTRPSSTNAGSYTTYWRLVGDSNHNDVASTSLSTTIAKASRTLSFADAYVVLAPSGNITKTATPSAGSGDGAITYSISSTTYATINSSSGKVTAKTSDGSAIVTATIAEGTNYLSATASYNLYVFATTHDFTYTGSVQNIVLPPGSYKLQCWGAQGGSNAADATYGITAQAGGKGGYAEGVLTIAAQTTLYAFVGGQGGASGNGGWNCGGGTTGSVTRTDDDTTYLTKMACGGGATDFALVTSPMSYSSRRNNRSDASLLSRIIVAGGGSGGAMVCVRAPGMKDVYKINKNEIVEEQGYINSSNKWTTSNTNYYCSFIDVSQLRGTTVVFNMTGASHEYTYFTFLKSKPTTSGQTPDWATGYSSRIKSDDVSQTAVVPNDAVYLYVYVRYSTNDYTPTDITFKEETLVNTTTAQEGYAGGGVNGDGSVTSSNDYRGRQDAAGTGSTAAFGKGANQTPSTYAVAAGAGGAGWYGGGTNNSLTDINVVKNSGGGSGFVNIAANAQYRPSGYTGIELDSGTTTIGTSSFPSTGGGTETGHSGNGYAKITRLS